MKKSVFLVFLAILFSFIMLFAIFKLADNREKTMSNAEIVSFESEQDSDGENLVDDTVQTVDDPSPSETPIKALDENIVQKWLEINEDVVGVIDIPGCNGEPFVNTPDQNEYLRKNIYDEYSIAGTLFTAQGSVPGQTVVTCIFGHNLDNGKMFGSLYKYQDLEFLKENPTFIIRTLSNIYEVKIIGVCILSSNYNLNEWYYPDPNQNARTFAKMVAERSIIDTGDKAEINDRFFILSTCLYDFDGERLAIVGRIVREGENIDVSHYTVNRHSVLPVELL